VDLTGGALLALAVLLTLAAAAATVVLWPRLSAQRPLPVLGRVGALVGVNVLVLVTVGLVANDAFGFFADWTDLTGSLASAPAPSQASRGGDAARAAAQRVPGEALHAPATPPALPKGAARSRTYSFMVTGPDSHVTGRVLVYLPAAYTDRKQATRRFPVIETFHGYPGRPEQWLDSMALGEALDQEVALGRTAPAIVVSPQLEIPPGRDTECVDGGAGEPAMETWLTTDVPTWVAHTFRVELGRSSWATAGFSEGGWCAAMAALLHPARYGASLVFGGYFRPSFSRTYVPFPAGSPAGRRYDLVALVKRDPPPVAMWIETSHSDRVSYRSSAAFLAAVRAPLAVRLVEFAHAGHTFLLWAPLVPQALAWLSTIGGFRPGP
jgi:enterochelin esterase-like enzyme